MGGSSRNGGVSGLNEVCGSLRYDREVHELLRNYAEKMR